MTGYLFDTNHASALWKNDAALVARIGATINGRVLTLSSVNWRTVVHGLQELTWRQDISDRLSRTCGRWDDRFLRSMFKSQPSRERISSRSLPRTRIFPVFQICNTRTG
jgi:hypothetical protein